MKEHDWRDGWLRRARSARSPNFGPRPESMQVDLVVLHSISLPPGEYGGDAIERLFANELDWNTHPYFEKIRGLTVSSHFLIRRDGELVQFVSCDDRAWHAGASHWAGRDDCNDFSVGIELEGADDVPYTDVQYEALATLIKALRRAYPKLRRTDVVGHSHVSPGRKTDPGPAFDWDRLTRLLAARRPRRK